MSKEDYYDLLGVSRDADAFKIKKAYRKLAVKYHPDKNQGDKKAEEVFKRISEAYEVLSNEEKRAAYNRFGHAAFQQGGMKQGSSSEFHDPFDVFKEVFGGGNSSGGIFEDIFGGSENRRDDYDNAQRGADLRYDLEITLEEAAVSVNREIQYRRSTSCLTCEGSGAADNSQKIKCSSCGGAGQVVSSRGFFSVRQTCPTCQGLGKTIKKPCTSCQGKGIVAKNNHLKVRIPAGVETGSKLRSIGNGDAGLMGGPSGDLYCVIHVKKHTFFERSSEDLYCEIPIKFTLATLGGVVNVRTLTNEASIKIPEGTQSGTTFRLKNYGMPSLQGRYKGDQLVRVVIAVPKKLTVEQKESLKKFAITCGDIQNTNSTNFSLFQKAKKFFE